MTEYREATDGVLVSSMKGPCCYAAATRQTVVVPEVAADPKWVKFREFAEPLGIRSCWSTPIFSSGGKVLGTFAHYYFEARDPSPRDERMVELMTRAAAVAIERSRAEAALRELNETLEQRVQAETRERLQIWNVSQDLLVICSLDGKYLSVNPAWSVTLGWSEADLLGKSFEWLLHPEDRTRMRAELDRLATGHKTVRFENRLRAKDGSYHWISWKAAPDSERIYGMGRDITESKRAQDALNRAGAELARVSRVTALSALTASIAHEVNQPLSGIITNAGTCLRMLDATPPDIDGARETARRTIRDGNRASDVIARLRALFSKREFTLEPLDLNEAAREVIALSSNDFQRNRIILQSELADNLPVVTGDRIQLQQVILNLLRNASDAMVDIHDRPRAVADHNRPRGGRRGALDRPRRGRRIVAGECRLALRCLLHHEDRRDGHRVVCLPLDHRETSRPSMGRVERRGSRRFILVLHSPRWRNRRTHGACDRRFVIELAWRLAEIRAYANSGFISTPFSYTMRRPSPTLNNPERPRTARLVRAKCSTVR